MNTKEKKLLKQDQDQALARIPGAEVVDLEDRQGGFFLGVGAGALSIVPYLGIMLSLLPAITIGFLQSDGGGPVLAGLFVGPVAE